MKRVVLTVVLTVIASAYSQGEDPISSPRLIQAINAVFAWIPTINSAIHGINDQEHLQLALREVGYVRTDLGKTHSDKLKVQVYMQTGSFDQEQASEMFMQVLTDLERLRKDFDDLCQTIGISTVGELQQTVFGLQEAVGKKTVKWDEAKRIVFSGEDSEKAQKDVDDSIAMDTAISERLNLVETTLRQKLP